MGYSINIDNNSSLDKLSLLLLALCLNSFFVSTSKNCFIISLNCLCSKKKDINKINDVLIVILLQRDSIGAVPRYKLSTNNRLEEGEEGRPRFLITHVLLVRSSHIFKGSINNNIITL